MNPLIVSFRVVGVYCYFEAIPLNGVSPKSTVKDVMLAIKKTPEGSYFDFESVALPPFNKEIVNKISYKYNEHSRKPYNVHDTPDKGTRELENGTDKMHHLVWQYYRSVTGKIDGAVVELKLIDKGQPSFANLPLDYYDPFFGKIPPTFVPSAYNLTWRLVELQMKPQTAERFQLAKENRVTTTFV